MHLIVFLYAIASILIEFQGIAQAGPILNEQIQVVHKLSPLNSYKDVQIFRFQIPAEMAQAEFRLNATHSEEPLLNSTRRIAVSEHLKRVGDLVLERPTTPSPPVIVFTESDTFPENQTEFDWHQYVNITKLGEYTDKAVKVYNSLRISACRRPLNVTFVLRWGALPLLDIKNASKPEHFVLKNATDQHKITLLTNGPEVNFQLSDPLPGDWYGMAFIDKRQDRIIQKGLERECYYRFVASLKLESLAPEKHAINLAGASQPPLKQSLVVDQSDVMAENFYKFYPTSSDLGAKIIIRNCHSNVNQHSNCALVVNMRSLAYPNATQHDFNFTCQSNDGNDGGSNTGKCILDLPSIAPNEWNYLQIIPSWQQPMVNEHESHANYAPVTGFVNYTIQILLGQDAYLYAHFNDQRCSSSASAQVSLGKAPHNGNSNSNNNNHHHSNTFGHHSGAIPSQEHAHVIAPNMMLRPTQATSSFIPSSSTDVRSPASSSSGNVIVAPAPSNSLSKETHEVKLSVPSRMNLTSTESKALDSIDFVEEEVEDEEMEKELADSSLSQFVKRAAEGPGQNKKKPDGRKKGQGQRNKPKNKMGRKKDQNRDDDDCQFDPKKVLATLDDEDIGNLTAIAQINLTRFQTGAPYEFRYVHTLNLTEMVVDPTGNSTANSLIEVDNERPTLLNFTVAPGVDIGGNLLIDFAISPDTRHRYQNVSAILCLTHNRLPPILASTGAVRFDDLCYGHLISNTSSANFTLGESSIQRLAIPFPQAGTWFVSIVVRCYTDEDTPEDTLSAMNMDYSGYSCEYDNTTSVMLNIRSAACLESRCLNGGKCVQYLSNGVVFSTCVCRSGWKGLVCDDGSEALSDRKVLLNFLFLVASNGAFIPAIVVAIFRQYFTEAAVYIVTMLFSALYHACDTDSPHSFCVADHRLLQFGDFYSSILAFFVTLITLANLSPQCKSFLHLAGAVSIALITQHDRTNVWTFVLPATVATILLFFCWCLQCCRRSCYPRARCWIFSVCPALVLTVVGLLIYAFYETEENYPITHSLWHVIVALALLFAIPSMPSATKADEDDEEEEERVHFMGSTSSSGAGSGKGSSAGMTNAKMAHVEWRPPHSSFKFLNDDIDML